MQSSAVFQCSVTHSLLSALVRELTTPLVELYARQCEPNLSSVFAVSPLHRIAQDCTGLHRIAQDCAGLHWIALDLTGLHRIALDCTGSYRIAQDCTGLYRIAQDCRLSLRPAMRTNPPLFAVSPLHRICSKAANKPKHGKSLSPDEL